MGRILAVGVWLVAEVKEEADPWRDDSQKGNGNSNSNGSGKGNGRDWKCSGVAGDA
jgi:hypothetical protein